MKVLEGVMIKNKVIDHLDISNAEQVLIDNGIDPDEAQTVLQAIGYTLLNEALYK